jgi:hypothetical protein
VLRIVVSIIVLRIGMRREQKVAAITMAIRIA